MVFQTKSDAGPKYQGISILIAEDNSTMRHMLREMLRKIGFEKIKQADDGDAALSIMLSEHVDIILCDWNMPRLNGWELLRKLRASDELRHIPFIMVTGESKQAEVAQAGDEDVDGYIVKPFNIGVLTKKIDTVLAERMSPSKISLHLKEGLEHLENGDLDRAEVEFNSALTLNPKSPRSLFALGMLAEKKGQNQPAAQYYENAVKLSPNFLKARDALALVLKAQGNSREATAQLRTSTSVSPNNMERQLNLGRILIARGEKEEAQKAFRKAWALALELNSEMPSNICESLLEAGLDQEAEQCFKKALHDDPGDIYTYNQLGTALRKQGKFRQAVDNYLKALEHDPDSEVLHFNLGRAYLEAKDRDNSIKSMQKALKIKPSFQEAKDFMVRHLKIQPKDQSG